MRRVVVQILVPLVGLTAALSAHAVPPPPFDRLVERLNSDTYQTREQATQDIASAASGVRLKQIEAQLKLPTLTLEQRTRLLVAAEHIFMREPRAALGVSWAGPNGLPTGRGVTVSGCVPGFEAATVLKPGDILRAIDGAPVEDGGYRDQDLRYEIVSRDPGDELRLSIIRGGEPMQVVCRVGKFDDLPRPSDRQSSLEGAWRKRLARMQAMVPTPPPFPTPLLYPGWQQAQAELSKADRDQAIANDQIARALGLDTRAVDVSIVVPMARIGGEPRGIPTAGSSDFDLIRDRSPSMPGRPDWRQNRRPRAM